MSERPTLEGSASPFLRHGAEQPVRWLPWGAEALELARAQDRPILLDIGAAWCHWCHVMDRESYEDPATAALVNELFVPVKVDRDERPDVDARYQRAVQALTGQGGWPLTAFLAPDGRAFYGGTYFPPQDGHGRPSFRRVLREIARVWREDRDGALKQADALRGRLAESDAALRQGAELSSALGDVAVEALADEFDFRHGGFGRAPKFPNPGGLHLLLDRWLDDGVDWQRRVVLETLRAMGRGGVFDQLGGGFHRYATDARWLIPHFEKMAYDNGPLLELYARAAATLDEPFFADVARAILRYYDDVAPALLARGGFPASQDADIGMDDDGDYWTWTADEVRDALGGDGRATRAALLRYGFDDPGAAMHLDPDRHVLFLGREAGEVAARLDDDARGDDGTAPARLDDAARALLDAAARALLDARARRPRPFVDETVYADWTALVASGHIAAARHLGAADAGAAALRALDRVWDDGWTAGEGVDHRPGGAPAGRFLADQACLAQACLDAFELTQDQRWLRRARALADVAIDRFTAPDGAGFVDRAVDAAEGVGALAEPHRPIADAPEPAGNAVEALALLRLHALTGEERYRRAALRTLTAFAGAARRLGAGAATYFRAVDWATRPVTTVVVVGAEEDAASDPLFRAALGVHRPRTVLRRLRAGEAPAGERRDAGAAIERAEGGAAVAPPPEPTALPPELRAMLSGDAPRAYVCVGRTCAAPVSDPAALDALLRTFRG